MSIYKRNKIWWIQFTPPSGKRIRKSSETTNKLQAQKFHDTLKASYWKHEKLGEKPLYLWDHAIVQWLRDNQDKSSIDIDIRIIKWLNPYLKGTALNEIDYQTIQSIAQTKAKETSNSTANRYLALLRSILNRAADEWEWIEKAPKVRMLRLPDQRIRCITKSQAKLLIAALPFHQAKMAAFGLATGLRQRNVCRLKWSQINMENRIAWIHPDQAKAKKAISVPLNDDAMNILQSLVGIDNEYVFTYRGKPVWQVNTKAWRKGVKAAGIGDFCWHDLRHTWASWHVEAGTSLLALKELGGWKSLEMVKRYAHLNAQHLEKEANNISIN